MFIFISDYTFVSPPPYSHSSGKIKRFLLTHLLFIGMDMKQVYKIIAQLEDEMVRMWSLGEAKFVLENDSEFIETILVAVHADKTHYQALGMVIGEA